MQRLLRRGQRKSALFDPVKTPVRIPRCFGRTVPGLENDIKRSLK
jgi:hypothetical protein